MVVEGEKYYARIIKVFPPKSLTNGSSSTPNGSTFEPHSIGVDLRVPVEDAVRRDDPTGYFYTVRLIQEPDHDAADGKEPDPDASQAAKWSGSEMEVKSDSLRSVLGTICHISTCALMFNLDCLYLVAIDYPLASPSFEGSFETVLIETPL